jgi:hypothetical protein
MGVKVESPDPALHQAVQSNLICWVDSESLLQQIPTLLVGRSRCGAHCSVTSRGEQHTEPTSRDGTLWLCCPPLVEYRNDHAIR